MPGVAHRRARAWHVTVTWKSGGQPWLVLVYSFSSDGARRSVEADVAGHGGTVARVEPA